MMAGSVPHGLDPRSAARVCGQFVLYKQLCPFLDRRITDDRRRSNRIVSGEAEVAYRTANRRGRIEDDNGVAVVVVGKVPACVENPADRDISVVVESAVGQ